MDDDMDREEFDILVALDSIPEMIEENLAMSEEVDKWANLVNHMAILLQAIIADLPGDSYVRLMAQAHIDEAARLRTLYGCD